MKRRGAVLLFAVAAAVGLYGVPAGAAGSHRSHDAHGHVLVVDKAAHHHRTCYGKYHRVFPAIQLAVNAADSGDTIKVCPGTYTETVKVETPDLTISAPTPAATPPDAGGVPSRSCRARPARTALARCSSTPTTSPGTGSRSRG